MNIRLFVVLALAVFLAAGLFFYFSRSSSRQKNQIPSQSQDINLNQPKTMKIASPNFENNADIPPKYTCDGKNVSPALEFSDIPAEAKSLALVMDDPDAPAAGGFVHWVIFNIDPTLRSIEENSPPENSVEGTNSAGRTGYTGPCPPTGTHRYFFKLYALGREVGLDYSAGREDVEKAMAGHILGQAELVGLYKRQ